MSERKAYRIEDLPQEWIKAMGKVNTKPGFMAEIVQLLEEIGFALANPERTDQLELEEIHQRIKRLRERVDASIKDDGPLDA